MLLAPEEYLGDLPPTEFTDGLPAFNDFENSAWKIGERVRQTFVDHPQLRKNSDLVQKVLEAALCKNLRRGRQSFVMALAFVGARPHAAELANCLDDPDINGHVIDTLLKMKATGHAHRVRPLLNSDKAWIRRLANRYINRYP